jgi:hypothetical protein
MKEADEANSVGGFWRHRLHTGLRGSLQRVE